MLVMQEEGLRQDRGGARTLVLELENVGSEQSSALAIALGCELISNPRTGCLGDG